MKMTKRIFIALLILAVSVSAFTVFASASDNRIADYENVLEYFEEQSLIDYDFGIENLDYSEFFLVNSTRANQVIGNVASDAGSPNGSYLSVAVKERSGRTAYTDNHVYFNWSGEEAIDDFNIDMTVSGEKYNSADSVIDENLPKIIIVVGENSFDNSLMSSAKTAGVTIASIDYRGGYFSYLKAVEKDGAIVGEQFTTSYKIEEGAWYNVSLTYDVDNGVSITVYNCADTTNAIIVTDGYVPYNSVKNVRIGAHGDDNGSARGSMMKFADVRLLGGVYHREISDMQSDVENKIIAMYDLFLSDDAILEDKIAVCEIVKKIGNYGFTSENPNVQKALAELSIGALGLYNAKIEEFVAGVDALPTFAEKRAYADEVQEYASALGEMDLSDASPDMVAKSNKNIADFGVVLNRLNATEDDSIEFIAVYESCKDHDITDYGIVVADIACFDALEPDFTYEGIEAAVRFYNRAVKAEEEIRTLADAFISAVNVCNDASLDFNSRAVAFDSAVDNYCDNETYPGITETLAIYNDVLVPFMTLEISNAENFIKYVKKADYAIYISAKQENLAIAKSYMDICQPGFAGVAEAKVLYAEVAEFIEEQIANANAYINAVNKLDTLSGAALTAGIEEALRLQESGNVLGVDGITEANIKLNQTIASIELTERYCIHFINIVNSIDRAADSAELYSILADARAAELDADKSYSGVADASAKLAKAISDFNAQVNSINADYEEANTVAANTCGVGGVADNTVAGQVIALIKKFFDEE